ncbi:MAG: DUF4168 domain-containing protein [Sphingomonas sp.]
MTILRTTATLIGATLLGSVAAYAQTTTAQPQSMSPQQAMPPQQATPPSSAEAPSTGTDATGTATSFSDADIQQFATAAMAVGKVQDDASVAPADKQSKMADAVKQSGLTPQKFNAIARASQSDPALMKRIQTAASAQATAQGQAGAAANGG